MTEKFLNPAEYDSWRSIRQSFPILFISSVHFDKIFVDFRFFYYYLRKKLQ
jgi:hypothetical protein